MSEHYQSIVNPLISIVIPVKNGAKTLNACLKGIVSQTIFHQCEIIIVDSGSEDESLLIAAQYPLRIEEIPSNMFNHGLTRNYAVGLCKGAFIVMTVQDAIAADNMWLQKLLDCFTDSNIAGVCGQQVVPHEKDKNPVQWFRPVSISKIIKYHFPNIEDFNSLAAIEKRKICGWDDVTAMYRKDVLDKIPFQKVSFAEDMLWAKDALTNGYSIVYNKLARVYHYHNDTPDFTYKRTLTELYFEYKIFGLLPQVQLYSIKRLASNIKLLLKANISLSKMFYWIKYNYEVKKNSNKAILDFQKALNQGEDYLDVFHEKICGIPPTPNTKNNG